MGTFDARPFVSLNWLVCCLCSSPLPFSSCGVLVEMDTALERGKWNKVESEIITLWNSLVFCVGRLKLAYFLYDGIITFLIWWGENIFFATDHVCGIRLRVFVFSMFCELKPFQFMQTYILGFFLYFVLLTWIRFHFLLMLHFSLHYLKHLICLLLNTHWVTYSMSISQMNYHSWFDSIFSTKDI